RLLAGGRDVKLVAEREALAEFELDAAPRVSRLEADHVPLDGGGLGRAAAAAGKPFVCRATAPPSADPPPITPLMPYFAMKSKARSEPLWIGCQHSTGRASRPAPPVSSLRG